MRKTLLTIILTALIVLPLAAETNQMRIVGEAEKTTDIVPARYQTVNRERAACIIFVTDLEVELDFVPNVELIAAVQEAPGQWNVYVAPFERRIDVFAFGYEPLMVILREFGIRNLQSGDVYRLRLTGDRLDVRSIENIYIAVQTTPSNATVYINDTKVEDSRQILAKVGKNTLRIEHPGYKTITDEIEVSEERPTFFEYRMELEAEVPIEINTTPAGANVSIDNLSMGISPVRAFFRSGRHRIRIVKEGYQEIDDWIEIEEPSTVKGYNLEDIRGTLTIKTNPVSRVYINDQHYPDGVSNLRLSPQLVRIRIVTPKADDINRNIAIRERENQVLELFPVLETGTVRIDVIPVSADVILTGDEGERYSSKGGKTFEEVPVGRYELMVRAEGHKSHRENFTLKADELIRKQIILEEGSDKVNVSITSTPSGADTYIDGTKIGVTPVSTGLYIGRRELELKKPPEYLNYRETITVTEQDKIFNLSMVIDPDFALQRKEFFNYLYRRKDDQPGKIHIRNTLIPFIPGTSVPLQVVYTSWGIAYMLPLGYKSTSTFDEVNYSSNISSWTWGWSVAGEIITSFTFEGGGLLDYTHTILVLDLFSINTGYIWIPDHHQSRLTFEADVGLRVAILERRGKPYKYLRGLDLLGLRLNYEYHLFDRTYFTVTGGSKLLYGNYEVYDDDDDDDDDDDYERKLIFLPYIGAGLRFGF